MAIIVRNLDKVSSGYPFFEKDQVLTADQLNQVSQYLDDQGRLTRTDLLGVGILSGLLPSVSGNQVTISRGVAVTTDGDLLRFPEGMTFAGAKPYDPAAPGFGLFVHDAVNIAAFPLVAQVADDPKAFSLADFQAQAGKPLADMVAMLVLESSLKSQDMCSGTDCDNMGQCLVDDLRVVLVDKNAAGAFSEKLVTPNSAARQLDDVIVDRPLFSGVTTTNELVVRYRAACAALTATLGTAFGKIFAACGSLLPESMPNDPAPVWVQGLNAVAASFAPGPGIQYQYGFLKDVAATYEAFRSCLFEDSSVCCPDVNAFPKYVLLGDLVGDASENRTGFYPSRHTRERTPALEHARFLLGKLSAQITSFALPVGAALPIRVTPSKGESYALEQRAIPFYYAPNGAIAIHQNWSFELHQRGMDAWNYGYQADQFGGRGAALNPLAADIGRFDLFRIEGHLGSPVANALRTIEAAIKASSLPFSVRAVMLGTDKGRLFINPKRTYSDLHRLHDLARFALADQLDDAADFTDTFRKKVDFAVKNDVVKGDDTQVTAQMSVSQVAADRTDAMHAASAGAAAALRQSYSLFQAPQWRAQYAQAQQVAGDLKQSLGKVAKNDFTTPIDTFVGSVHAQWIDWLDLIIKKKDDSTTDKLLFTAYHDLHPGFEHCAGVMRGGTFVLVYDEANTVVADFALAYQIPDVESPAEEPPPPPKPPRVWPNFYFDQGITVRPSLESTVKGGIDKFWVDEKPQLEAKIASQKEFLNFGVQLIDATVKAQGKTQVGVAGGLAVQDAVLNAQLEQLDATKAIAQKAREKLQQGGLTPEQETALKNQITATEKEVATKASAVAGYVKTAGSSLAAGGDGLLALNRVGDSIGTIQTPEISAEARNNLGGLSHGATPEFTRVIGTIAAVR